MKLLASLGSFKEDLFIKILVKDHYSFLNNWLKWWSFRILSNFRLVVLKNSFLCRHIGKGCDRDTYSVQSQRKLCGASPSAIDLLPSPGVGAEWTKPLISDEGHESDQMFEFDGSSTAVSIPNHVLDHNLPPTFTFATWMRHAQHPNQDKHIKEHILCSADDHSK